MKAPRTRRFVLAALVLASLWSFVPVPVGDEPILLLPVCYDHLGLYFFLSRGKAVTAVGVEAPDDSPSPEGALDGRARPSAQEVIPGVGACRVLIGETDEVVIRTLGPAALTRCMDSCSWMIYEDLSITLEAGRVISIVTSRGEARTPEGIGVGSGRDEMRRVYAARGRESGPGARPEQEGNGAAADSITCAPVQNVATGWAWHSQAASAVLGGLFASLLACLCLSLAPRRHVWSVLLAVCIGTWVGVYLGTALWWLILDVWFWIQGSGGCPFTPEENPFFTVTVWSLMAESRRSSQDVVILAGVVGLFAVGRVAIRWLRLCERGAYPLCCLGAVVSATAVRALVNVLRSRPPYILTLLSPARGNLVTRGVIPSLALSVCFLVVASQRTRWWEAVRSVLGLPVTQKEQDGEA